MILCSVCKKNMAVIFLNKFDKEGKPTGETTGLCVECAKKQGIDPLSNIMKEMENISNKIKKVIGVVSGKGGVGKSLVTSMLAVLMIQMKILMIIQNQKLDLVFQIYLVIKKIQTMTKKKIKKKGKKEEKQNI